MLKNSQASGPISPARRFQPDRTRFKDMAKPKLKQHHINRDWCKGCGICVELCPKKVLALDEQDKVTVVRPQDCICCRLCELRCPDFAIEVEMQE
jgi:2-oxoglutarate ferredoxin oxidoreductase subunit delta